MVRRVFIGRRPDNNETGFWVSKPGYDAYIDDRTDPAKFRFSTNFSGRRPLRILKAGKVQTNTAIPLPSLMGGEAMLTYRLMLNGNQERANGYYGSENENGGARSASEFYNRMYNGNEFRIHNTASPDNQGYTMRYMVILF